MTLLTLILTSMSVIGIIGFGIAIVAAISEDDNVAAFFGTLLATIIVVVLYAIIQSLIYLVAQGVIA